MVFLNLNCSLKQINILCENNNKIFHDSSAIKRYAVPAMKPWRKKIVILVTTLRLSVLSASDGTTSAFTFFFKAKGESDSYKHCYFTVDYFDD